jgi:hypothetical protein
MKIVVFLYRKFNVGLGGLKQMTIQGLPDVKGGSADKGIHLEVKVKLINPSNVIMNANTDAIFDL